MIKLKENSTNEDFEKVVQEFCKQWIITNCRRVVEYWNEITSNKCFIYDVVRYSIMKDMKQSGILPDGLDIKNDYKGSIIRAIVNNLVNEIKF